MQCPNCGSQMEYHGATDGGGDYGTEVCEEWECPECGLWDEFDCIEVLADIELEDGNFQDGYADG